MTILDDLVKNMLRDREGTSGGGAGTPLTDPIPLTRESFPRGARGELVNPQYVATEGERIRNSLAEGTYGEQPLRAAREAAGEPQITVARASGLLEDQPPIVFEQAGWNLDPSQVYQDLRLDELRTRAARNRMELEETQRRQPLRDAIDEANYQHTLAATAALGSTERRKAIEDAQTMHDVAAFNEGMINAGTPGTPEFVKNVRTLITKYPRIATTNFGQQDLFRQDKAHSIASAIAEAGGIPGGMKPSSFHVGPQGVSLTYSNKEAEQKFGVTPADIQSAVKINVGTPDKEYNPDNPTKITAEETGSHVAIVTSDGKTKVIPTQVYEQLGGTYSPETLKKRQAAMAEKALADPNATADQKARARQILGR